MRVQLESTNLITGQKQLSVALHPDAPPAKLEKQDGAYVIPVAPGGGGGGLSGSATPLLSKLDFNPVRADRAEPERTACRCERAGER